MEEIAALNKELKELEEKSNRYVAEIRQLEARAIEIVKELDKHYSPGKTRIG